MAGSVNYFEHHIGDYAQATGHLSFIEDAAYHRIIRKYYADERQMPPDIKAVQRLVGARSREERDAVEVVLREFFELREDGWHQRRCDDEIAKYRDGDAEREQRAANERDRVRRHRDERARMFADLREQDIIPKWDTPTTKLREIWKRTCNAPETRTGALPETPGNVPVTATGNAPFTASHTQTQYPIQDQEQVTAGIEATQLTDAGRACLLMRHAGCGHVSPGHPNLLAALAEGVTPEELGETVREGIGLRKSNPFQWAIATARGRRAEGATPIHAGQDHENRTSGRRLSAVGQVEQAIRDRRATAQGAAAD